MRTLLFLLMAGIGLSSCEKQITQPENNADFAATTAVEAQKDQVWNLGWKPASTTIAKEWDEKLQSTQLVYKVQGKFSGPWSKMTVGYNEKDGFKQETKLVITNKVGFVSNAQITWNNFLAGEAIISFTVSEKALLEGGDDFFIDGDVRVYMPSGQNTGRVRRVRVESVDNKGKSR
jgi:hypothetical protein